MNRTNLFSNQKKYTVIISKLYACGWTIFGLCLCGLISIYVFFVESIAKFKASILIFFIICLSFILLLLLIYFRVNKKLKVLSTSLESNSANIKLKTEDVFNNFSRVGTIKQLDENKFYVIYKKLGIKYKVIFIIKNDLQKDEINGRHCFSKINKMEGLEDKVNFWACLSSTIIFLTNKLTPDLEKKLNRNNDDLMRRVESITLCAICSQENKFYIQPHLGLESHTKYLKNLKILSQILELQ